MLVFVFIRKPNYFGALIRGTYINFIRIQRRLPFQTCFKIIYLFCGVRRINIGFASSPIDFIFVE